MDSANNRQNSRSSDPSKDRTEHPFREASQEGLHLLIRVVLERDEVIDFLKAFGVYEDFTAGRTSLPYDRLASLVRRDYRSANALDSRCDLRFADSIEVGRSCSMFELAQAWGQARSGMDDFEATGYLWMAARSSYGCYRKLETVIVKEIECRAARSLMRNSPGLRDHVIHSPVARSRTRKTQPITIKAQVA